MSYGAKETSQYEGAPVECFEFSMGATFYRYTSADTDITIAAGTFTAVTIARGGQDFSQENTAANIAVTVPTDNAVAQLFVSYTPQNPVGLTIYRKHRTDAEVVVIFVGKVTSVAFTPEGAVLTCAPISQVLKRLVPVLTYQNRCPWALYGAGCGLDKDDWKDACTLSAVDGVTLTSADFDAQPDGWFTNGWIQRANGDRRFIVAHVGAVVTLMNPFPASLVATEVVDAYAGCDRTEATCASKFDNLVNHVGFARIPAKNPYSGEAID